MARIGGKHVINLEHRDDKKAARPNVRCYDFNTDTPLDYSSPERNFSGNFAMFQILVDRLETETLP